MLSNRVKVVHITTSLFIEMLKLGKLTHVKCVQGLPNDAEVVRAYIDNSSLITRVGLVITSSEFPEVEDGKILEEATVLFDRI